MDTRSFFFLVILFLYTSFYSYGQSPEAHPNAHWEINNKFTNEFNGAELDQEQWTNDVNSWGTWSWDPNNAYIKEDALALRMYQETHSRNGKDFYFKSGIYQNRETVTYGYFETSIKASAKGQGTCPAFWLYSRGQPIPTEEDAVQYCEIDAIEIFQVPNQLQRLEMNLHTRIIENGQLTWKRPGQGNRDLTHNTWVAPWDPRDDFHTYGVWNRLDSIIWYVDGIQRGAKKNHYWHLPMYPTVSMGLRTPYERYINGVRTIQPYPDTEPEEGFPTEMFCDYVRAWKTDPQLYADKEKYYNAEFPTNLPLVFNVRYFAGNGEQVLPANGNGVSCKLQEITADGTVVKEYEEVDAASIGKESGLIPFNFSVDSLPLSSDLPAGNQYILRPIFTSSFNGGENITFAEEYYPIQVVEKVEIVEEEEPTGTGNLLQNPNFETGTSAFWTSGGGSGTINIIQDAQDGTYGAKGNVEQLVDLEEGVSYTLTCYVKNLTPDVNVWVGIRDMVNAKLVTNFLVTTTEYEKVTIDFTSQATGQHRFWVWGEQGSEYYSDNFVLLKEGTVLIEQPNLIVNNLLKNPDFESGELNPWIAGNGNTVNIIAESQNGNYAAQGNIEQLVDLEAGADYIFTGYAKNLTPDLNVWVGIRDMVRGELVKNYRILSSDYESFRIEFTSQSDGSHRFWAWGVGGSDYVSDNFVLVKVGEEFITNISEAEIEKKVKITPIQRGVMVNLDPSIRESTIFIHSLSGQLLYRNRVSSGDTFINNAGFPLTGLYLISVQTNQFIKTEKIFISK